MYCTSVCFVLTVQQPVSFHNSPVLCENRFVSFKPDQWHHNRKSVPAGDQAPGGEEQRQTDHDGAQGQPQVPGHHPRSGGQPPQQRGRRAPRHQL